MPFATIHGSRLHYEVRGQGEPVLLIHGLGSSTLDWEAQVNALEPFYQTITFDLRGHGVSDKTPGSCDIPRFAADGAGLLGHLGISSAHVVGWSLGGAVAYQLAVDMPRLVRSLVVVNTSPVFRVDGPRARLEFAAREWIARTFGMRALGHLIARRLFPGPENAGLRRTFVTRWAGNHLPCYLASLRAIAGWSVRQRLAGITAPVLIVAAEHDYFPVSFQREIVAELPRARLIVVPGTRHALPAEQPAAFSNLLLDFLRSATISETGG